MEIKSTLTKYPGTIILPDYLTPDQVFAVEDAQFAAREYWRENTIKETVKDEEGKDKARFEITEAWPSKYDPMDLNAKGNDVSIETLELVNEGVVRTA